jgi:hypothetical protein
VCLVVWVCRPQISQKILRGRVCTPLPVIHTQVRGSANREWACRPQTRGVCRPARLGPQPTQAGLHPRPESAAMRFGSIDLEAWAFRPPRLGLQPYEQGSPNTMFLQHGVCSPTWRVGAQGLAAPVPSVCSWGLQPHQNWSWPREASLQPHYAPTKQYIIYSEITYNS